MATIRKGQRLCLELLQQKERNGETVSRKEIAAYTGWKEEGTAKTYLSKGNLEDYITLVDKQEQIYKVHNTLAVSIEDFAARITQVHASGPVVGQSPAPPVKLKLSDKLLEKSIHAALSAIEIYNKPDFKYREETFSILMVNAWELLTKARILKENNEQGSSIHQKRKKEDGSEYVPESFCGNPLTIGIHEAMIKAQFDAVLSKNLDALIEIRDNSIHHFNDDSRLSQKVLEVGTASLRSYVTMVNEWFKYDLTRYNFYLMPLSFFHLHELESHSVSPKNQNLENLLLYIAKQEKETPSDAANPHNISLILRTEYVNGSSPNALLVARNGEASDITAYVNTEEEFGRKYKWTYDKLIEKLRGRYSDFKYNNHFHDIHRELVKDKKYRDFWYLNFQEKTGTSKPYYDPNIIPEFDKYYTKKKSK